MWIIMIKSFDGKPVQFIEQGEFYLVPTVRGLPVIIPSHIDEGTEGPTTRHWHVDRRWGPTCREIDFWSDETREQFGMVGDDELSAAIIKDEGQPIEYQMKRATETLVWPSGGVFASLVWLYHHFGHLPATDGHCVHHRTQLTERVGELICPAHGLRYKLDGSPRFQGPFFLKIRYCDPYDFQLKYCQEPLKFDEPIVFDVPRQHADTFPVVSLVDSIDEEVMRVSLASTEDKISITVKSWPSDSYCPSVK
jgi:hypothetical protein